MLFFVKGGPKDKEAPPPFPQDQWFEYVVKEWETVIDYKQQGKILEAYGYGEQPGGFIIYDVGSRDELENLLARLPLHQFTKFEIMPLITAEQALERSKQGKISGPGPNK
jgi:muconolactone delta-isomerase